MNRSLQRRPTHCTPTKRPTLLPQLGRALPQGFWYTKLDSWARHAEVKMAESWADDVKKYVPDANDKAISGIVKYCGIALQNRDSSLVSFTDPEEVARVRNNFLKKKLGLTDSDANLDKAIMSAAEKMKGDRTKNRVTVYYLLAAHFGKLSMFS
jgi:Protein of unknown function (DUF2853)